MRRPNVLFITLDQLRNDTLGCDGHPLVQTPHLDALAQDGVRFARHFANSSPCGPGRASLYTGLYQSTHRVMFNGTPLDDRFDNVARMARRAGYAPTLFGYTDQAVDPRTIDDPNDPRWSNYEEVLPGFDVELDLTQGFAPWRTWLETLGYEDLPTNGEELLAGEPRRHEDHSQAAFLADHVVAWLREQTSNDPWFAHVSILRPHDPYAAAGRFATMYDPADVEPPIPAPTSPDAIVRAALKNPFAAAPTDPLEMAQLQAQYFGMVSEVDHQVGRIFEALKANGAWDDTLIVVTSDHGEQLGDQGLISKLGYFPASYRIPCIIRDPFRPTTHGNVIDHFTENVDLLPSLAELMGQEVTCDGQSLVPFLDDGSATDWRDAATYEWSWRHESIFQDVTDRTLETQQLTARVGRDRSYVHFGNGTARCFDLSDPSFNTEITDSAIVLEEAQAMLTWHMTHAERTLSRGLMMGGGLGELPGKQPS